MSKIAIDITFTIRFVDEFEAEKYGHATATIQTLLVKPRLTFGLMKNLKQTALADFEAKNNIAKEDKK